MKKIIVLLLMLVAAKSSFSQTNNKLWGGVEIGLGYSLSDNGNGYNYSLFGKNQKNKMETSTLRAVLGYYIVPQLSVGAGIGLSSYTMPGLNTLPVCIDLRYHPVADNMRFILNWNLGYSLTTSEEYLDGGFMTDISLGYRLFNLKKISFTPAIGYNYNTYLILPNLTQHRHSIFFKIGIYY